MRHFMIPLTLLAISLAVGVARSQDSTADAKRQAQSKAKKEQVKKGKTESVADVGATDPGDPNDATDPAVSADGKASDTDGIGGVLLADDPQDDPADAGKRMVMRGLGLQVGALVAKIRSTDDPKAREPMEAELRETVKIAVELRKKYRKDRIVRLENLIARLRKESEEDSIDTVIKQLLSAQRPTGSGTDPGDNGDDPAANASGGTDNSATSADDPTEASDDPAEPKSKKKKAATKKDKSE